MTVWKSKRLGELCTIELGKTPSRSTAAFWDVDRLSGNVWLSIADLLNANGNFVDESKEYISDKGATLCKQVRKGTLLASFKLTLGRLAFAARDLFTNEAIAALTIHDENELGRKYLFYFLHFFDWIKAAENDVKLKGMTLNKAKLKEINVNFPPLPEQQRIVAVLDEAFVGLAVAAANAEKNLKNAREVFDSYQQSIFRGENGKWEIVELGQICTFENGDRGSNYPHRTEYVSSGIPWINTGHIQSDGTLSHSTMNYITLEKFNSLRSGKIHRGDLVYCLRGATLGKTALVAPYSVGAVASSLVIIRPKPLLNSHFLYYFLTSQLGQSLIGQYENGAAQPNLGAKNVAKFKIAIPSLEQQTLLVEDLDSLRDKTISLANFYKSKLAAIAELKQSLLQKAFTGELTKDFRSDISLASSINLHAGLLAFVFERHRQQGNQNTLGRVKAQKFLHLVESVGHLDLGRKPMKDAAGPNDSFHMQKAESWAKEKGFFEFVRRSDGGYDFIPLGNFASELKTAETALEPYLARLKPIIDALLEMNSQEAEVFATVHAAWNNMIKDEVAISDEAIILEARDKWSSSKLAIPVERFRLALSSIRARKMEPDGSAKYVGGQAILI